MPIRDILLTGTIVGSLPFCFVSPYVGVLVWSWLGFMNPHRLSWGFAQSIPFSLIVAISTLGGLLVTSDRRRLPRTREVVLLVTLWAFFVITTVFATQQDRAWSKLEEVSKIFLMIFVTILVCQERRKLRGLLLVVALSIGYYGLRGGLWGLVTGGEGWALGPETTQIGDNTGLALGLTMTLPMLLILAREEPRRWLRTILYLVFFSSILGVVFTYARSGFLGLAVVLGWLFRTTKWKVVVIPVSLVAVVVSPVVIPERWFDRMKTILEYQQDGSAMSRFNAWHVGWQLALDSPLVGGGFWAFETPDVWRKYLPEGGSYNAGVYNAHSIYFHVLGEHGFIGFGLFVGLVICALLSLRRIRREARGLADGAWLANYADMTCASVLGFLVTGAFLNQTYFDLFYLCLAVTIILQQLLRDHVEASQESVGSGSKASEPTVAMRSVFHWSTTR